MHKPINLVEFASRVCLGPGSVTRSQDAALKDITQPQPVQVWRSAWGEVYSMFEAAIENYKTDPSEYNRGRMDVLADASARLHERYVKA